MNLDDGARLVRLAITTAVQLLEMQDGLLYPIGHGIDANERVAFVGAYNGSMEPEPVSALAALRSALRAKHCRCTAITYGCAMPDASGRNALCVEFESLDAPAETIFVPFVITRPWLRQARVITYAPVRMPGRNHVLRRGGAQR